MPSTNATEECQPSYYQHQVKNYSSSTTTVHRTASIGSSQSISRTSALTQAAQVPLNTSTRVTDFRGPVTPPKSRQRPGLHGRSNSISGVREGVGNLNRWSQSTASSRGSTEHKRSSSNSRRMSFENPGTFNLGVPRQTASKLQNPRPAVGESPPQTSPRKPSVPPTTSFTSLPAIITLPASQPNDLSSPLTTTSAPSTAGVPSTAVPNFIDQACVDPIPRNPTTKLPIRDGTPIELLQSSGVSTEKAQSNYSLTKHQRQKIETSTEHGRSKYRSQVNKGSSGVISSEKSRSRPLKQPSQKAMLSKALQKANTAVLLDNAQNFEAAMQAYAEACGLLEQVMTRSSGDEDKRKLEAIVSDFQQTYELMLTQVRFL